MIGQLKLELQRIVAIDFPRSGNAAAPSDPCFTYLALASTHAGASMDSGRCKLVAESTCTADISRVTTAIRGLCVAENVVKGKVSTELRRWPRKAFGEGQASQA